MYHTINANSVLNKFGSSKYGLSQEQVNQRKLAKGKVSLNQKNNKNIVLKFLAQLTDLMVLTLLISSVVSIVLGFIEGQKSEIIDGCIILGIVITNASLGVFQERKAEKSMEALKKLSEPECNVMRNGLLVRLRAKDLVEGDVIVFEAGSIIPADCRLLEDFNLFVNESALTGESMPVEKNSIVVLNENTELSERKNMVFKGTTVAKGRGTAVVVSTGENTEFGKIATRVSLTKKEITPLQKSIKDIGKILTYMILLMATVIFILEFLARGNIIQAFLTAVAISVAAIPESMPAVITIIMSIGIANLSKQKVIIKKMHAVETLGACDVICSDKTGTITQNKMTVIKYFCNGRVNEEKPSEIFLNGLVLCNDVVYGENGFVGDPTEIALCEFGKRFGFYKTEVSNKYKRLDEIPFDSKKKMMTSLNDYENGTVFCKGAVDEILCRCKYIETEKGVEPLTDKLKNDVIKTNQIFSENALRVLALAVKRNAKVITENELTFVGLVGMMDPPRKEIYDAVLQCHKAGMRAVMITGDHPETAFAIAKQVGIAKQKNEVMTGKEIDSLSDEEFLRKIEKISVYARVSPENKARIVSLLKEKGHIVAMTGDGVNDAPSLKEANIGIGMGKEGTDVAKEVADMVVTDDNFASIVVAVKEGRNVYKNIQKTVKYLFSANMGEILSLFIASVFFPNLIFLLPVQILFVNLITDSLPAIALGMEKSEQNLMQEKPRGKNEGILYGKHGKELLFMGLCQTGLILLSYFIGLKCFDQNVAMTMAFYTLNFIQLFFLFSARTEMSVFKSNPFKNKWFNISLVFGFGLLGVIAITPFHDILNLKNLSPGMWLVTILLSVFIIVISEIYKKSQSKNAF